MTNPQQRLHHGLLFFKKKKVKPNSGLKNDQWYRKFQAHERAPKLLVTVLPTARFT